MPDIRPVIGGLFPAVAAGTAVAALLLTGCDPSPAAAPSSIPAASLTTVDAAPDRTPPATTTASTTAPASQTGTTSSPLGSAVDTATANPSAAVAALDDFNDWLAAQPGIEQSGYIQSVNDPSGYAITLIWFGDSPLQAAASVEASRRAIGITIEQWPYSSAELEAAAQTLFDQTDAFLDLGFEVSDISAIPPDYRGVDLCGAFLNAGDGNDGGDIGGVVDLAAQFTEIPVRVRTDCSDS